jgi:hypothetical protein
MTIEQTIQIGETFPAHFVWQLPDGDYVRAVFEAEVLSVVDGAMKYLVRLRRYVAGRQESAENVVRTEAELATDYWTLVFGLIGHRCTLAWELSDGSPVYMRLATLTGEHDFFHRYDQPPEALDPEKYGPIIERIRAQIEAQRAEKE